MELILKNENDTLYTIFKIPPKELNSIPARALRVYGYKPFKVTSRFIWYKIKGDFLNGRFEDE